MKSSEFISEGDVIQHKFGTKQAQKGKDKYKFDAEFAKDIPKFDTVGKRNIPSGIEYRDVDYDKLVPYDHFEVAPTRSGKAAHILGVYNDGNREYKVQTSTTTIDAAEALVDMYNRGGFTDKEMRKIPLGGE